jgi:hypothetical protein
MERHEVEREEAMSHVYILRYDYNHEPGDIISVFATMRSAVKEMRVCRKKAKKYVMGVGDEANRPAWYGGELSIEMMEVKAK